MASAFTLETDHNPLVSMLGSTCGIPMLKADSCESSRVGTHLAGFPYGTVPVTATIEKVFENACLVATDQTSPAPLSNMLFRFRTARSPEMSSVILSEAIVNAVHYKQQLYIVFPDASKH